MPSRRRFMTAAASAALLPDALSKAFATPARRIHGSIRDVEHVVILMQENRAFDHYFGTLRGVRGYDDPCAVTLPSGRSVFHQPIAPGVEDEIAPFRLNADATSAECMASLDHSWKGQQSLWRNHDAWVPVKGPLTMGYFTRHDIPFYYALADAFTICDAYHCSIFGPTNPNRLFLFTGTSGLSVGRTGAQVAANADDGNWTADAARDVASFAAYDWTTYAERLQAAGVSWKLYQEYDNFGDNSLAFFAAFRGLAPDHELYRRGRAWVEGSTAQNASTSFGEHLIAAFAGDVAADRLPQVSWLVAPTSACEHPDASPSHGEGFTARLIAALAANPDVYAKTIFILNYDENDGFFDHVPPPIPAIHPVLGASTVAAVDEIYAGQPVGLGPRVPLIVVSPWTRGGWVNSQLFEHTSVLRLLEARFGVVEPNIGAWRRAVTGDLTSVFDFSTTATAPALPSTNDVVARVEAACKLEPPLPTIDAREVPRQEPGQRPARPLPYVLHVEAEAAEPNQPPTLVFRSQGAAGVCFTVRTPGAIAGPWSYTVEAGKSLVAAPSVPINSESGGYDLTVFGPNGFLRRFRGNVGARQPRVAVRYVPETGRIVLRLTNTSEAAGVLAVRSNMDPGQPVERLMIAPGQTLEHDRSIAKQACWYDVTVASESHPDFECRVAGHMETGVPSLSDPRIGRQIFDHPLMLNAQTFSSLA